MSEEPAVYSTEQVSDPFIEEAVEFIIKMHHKHYLEMSLEIGNYVFEKFFDSDASLVSSKDPNKITNYNKLLQHEKMCMDKSRLSRMVKVAIQEKLLEQSDVNLENITYSHRIELLTVADEQKKLELSRKMQEEALSVRQLREEIKKITPEKEANPLVVNSQTLHRFESSIKAIDKVDELLKIANLASVKGKIRGSLYDGVNKLYERTKDTSAKLQEIIQEMDAIKDAKSESSDSDSTVATSQQ